jgi:hypothetical protein
MNTFVEVFEESVHFIRYEQLARLRDKNVSLSYSYKNLRNPQSTAFYAPNEVFINFLQKLYK